MSKRWLFILAAAFGCGDNTGLEGFQPGTTSSKCSTPAIVSELVVSGNAGVAPQYENPELRVVFTRADVSPGVHLSLSLWEGAGALANGFQVGAFPLLGKETDLRSCGICLALASAAPGDTQFFAFFGTATIREIDAVPGGRLSASIQDLHMREVKYDQNGLQQDVELGCSVLIDSIEVDMSVQQIGE